MSNTFLTPSIIAREALMLLRQTMATMGLVNRNFTQDFTGAKVGDTVKVAVPPVYEAKEFTSAIDVQNITQGEVPLVIEKHFDVSVEVTSKQRTLELTDFSRLVIQPAVLAIAEKVNAYILSKYVEVPYFYNGGTAGSPAFGNTVALLANIGKVLNENKAPLDPRYCVISPTAEVTLLGIEAFHRADARGDGAAINQRQLRQFLGLNWFMDQQVPTHTKGTMGGSPVTAAGVSAGASVMNISGTTTTNTLVKGDLISVADAPGTYVVTANIAAVSGTFTGVAFYPPAPAGGFGSGKVVTLVNSHKANLAFHPNAFALATLPPDPPSGASNAATITAEGLGIRVVEDYNISAKKDVISFDLLAGAKTVHPELAARVLEAV
jgi:hypothetical protein